MELHSGGIGEFESCGGGRESGREKIMISVGLGLKCWQWTEQTPVTCIWLRIVSETYIHHCNSQWRGARGMIDRVWKLRGANLVLLCRVFWCNYFGSFYLSAQSSFNRDFFHARRKKHFAERFVLEHGILFIASQSWLLSGQRWSLLFSKNMATSLSRFYEQGNR